MKPKDNFKVWSNGKFSAYLLQGDSAKSYVDTIASFRLNNFKEFPYLYGGDLEEEREYLNSYCSCEFSNTILFYADDVAIGYSSSTPLKYETDNIKDAMQKACKNIDEYLYLCEIIFSYEARNQGLAKVALEIQKECALKLNLHKFCYISVKRDENDPNRPSDYFSSDKIFARYGFAKIDACEVELKWRSIISKTIENNSLNIYEKCF